MALHLTIAGGRALRALPLALAGECLYVGPTDVIAAVACFSEQGLGIANEDRYLVDSAAEFFAVFDGEGAAGAVAHEALELTREALTSWQNSPSTLQDVWCPRLVGHLQYANSLLFELGRARRRFGATTALLVKVLPDSLVVASVGDSRLYLRRDTVWHRGSTDHSLLEDPEAPQLEQDLLALHSSVVTRAVAATSQLEPFLCVWPRTGLDALSLCTDGAWRPFDGNVLPVPPGSPSNVTARLLDLWRRSGSRDDATVIAATLV